VNFGPLVVLPPQMYQLVFLCVFGPRIRRFAMWPACSDLTRWGASVARAVDPSTARCWPALGVTCLLVYAAVFHIRLGAGRVGRPRPQPHHACAVVPFLSATITTNASSIVHLGGPGGPWGSFLGRAANAFARRGKFCTIWAPQLAGLCPDGLRPGVAGSSGPWGRSPARITGH